MTKFIRLKQTSGNELNIQTSQIHSFVPAAEGTSSLILLNGSTVQVQESNRVIRGLIEPKAAE